MTTKNQKSPTCYLPLPTGPEGCYRPVTARVAGGGILCQLTMIALLASLMVGLLFNNPAGAQQKNDPNTGRMYRQAQQLLRNNKSVQAEQLWLKILLLSPGHFNTHLALGKLYGKRHPDLALNHLNNARSIRPGSHQVHYFLGQQLERANKLGEAAESYRQAIRINARHYAANKRLRNILRRLRAAKTVVQKAAEQMRKHPNLGNLTLFGKIAMRESGPKQALWEFEALQEQFPDLPEISLWVARAQRKLGSLEGEISAYKWFLETDGDATGVRLVLLERLLEAGSLREAIALFDFLGDPLRQKRLNTLETGQFYYLKSRLLMARGDPGESGKFLLLAGHSGYDPGKITGAYRKDVRLYPDNGVIWMDFGQWLETSDQLKPAADAYLKAGKLDESLLNKARAALGKMAESRKGAIYTNLYLGELALEAGDETEAIARLDAIQPGERNDRRASLLLGLLYRKRGELEPALEAFTRYVFSFPDKKGMTYARGKLFWEMGKTDAATAFWGKQLKEMEGYPDALTHLARHYKKTGEKETELTVRQMLKKSQPGNLPNRIRVGELLEDQGRLAEAIPEWEAVAREKTGDFDLLVRVGKAYLKLGKEEQGAEMLSRAAQVNDLDPELVYLLGRHVMKRNRYREALEIYRQIYLINPAHPDLQRTLPELVLNTPAPPNLRLAAAKYASEAGRAEIAVDILEELIGRYPEEEKGRLMLAGIFMANDELEEAERVVMGVPGGKILNELELLRLLAEAQQRLGKNEALIDTLKKLLKHNPDDLTLQKRLAILLVRYKHYRQARPILFSILSREEEETDILYLLANTELALGQVDSALFRLEKLLILKPEDELSRMRVMEILLKARRWPELIYHLEIWLMTNPQDVLARQNIITAYLQQFQKDAARPHYQELKKINPNQARALAGYFGN